MTTLTDKEQDLIHRAKRGGSASVAFGTITLIVGVIILAILSTPVSDLVSNRDWQNLQGFLVAGGLPVLILVVGGLLLVVGGLRFRRHENSGRRILVVAIVGYMVLLVSGLAYSVADTATMEETPLWGRILGIGVQLLLPGAALFLLWRAIRFLRSPRVVDLCSAGGPSDC